MNKVKPVIARNAHELANHLGLSASDAVEMEVRRRINDKLIEAVNRSGLTQAQVAKAAGTSRARLNAVLNRNTTHVSTDLMLRILAAMGYKARIAFTKSRSAA